MPRIDCVGLGLDVIYCKFNCSTKLSCAMSLHDIATPRLETCEKSGLETTLRSVIIASTNPGINPDMLIG